MTTPPTILVVDDEPAIRALVSDVLTSEGYRVRQAGDGEAALRLIEQERPAAIVANVAMPRLDGVRLTAILRERGLVIPTILMSAAGEPPGHAAFLFVSKPFELDHLLAVVERAIATPGADQAARSAADD